MRLRLDLILFALIAAIFVAHSTAVSLSWYFVYPWIDIPMHIICGFWTGLLFMYLFLERQRVLSADIGFINLAFLCLGFVAFIGVGWEFYEYFSSVFLLQQMPFGGSAPGAHFDTLKDLFDDLLGGLLAMTSYYLLKLRRAKTS